MDKKLRDKNGKLVGFIRSYDDREEIRSVNGTLKGFYYYKLNQTRNVNGSLVGFGNLLTTLL
jgi:hypothetical protein